LRTMVFGPLGYLVACIADVGPLRAESYPERPITIIVPFGKGTTAELVAVVVAEAMSKKAAQKVTVDLKPGAGFLDPAKNQACNTERLKANRCSGEEFFRGHRRHTAWLRRRQASTGGQARLVTIELGR